MAGSLRRSVFRPETHTSGSFNARVEKRDCVPGPGRNVINSPPNSSPSPSPDQEEADILRELGYWVTGQWCKRADVDPPYATQLVDRIVETFKVRPVAQMLRYYALKAHGNV